MLRSIYRSQTGTTTKDTSLTHIRSEACLPALGETIGGKYRLVRQLGEGGAGVVYEAVHMRLQQPLAIKVLRPDVCDVREVLARFEREARITAQLRSVHAARVVDVDALPSGLPYLVMELLEGIDLDSELNTSGPLPVEQAVDIVLQVADAMSEAHGIGIVHRDLKPSNLFVCRVTDRRIIKVLDFGIAKVEGDSRITASDVCFGTPCYAAPEQLRAAADADARSDIWSLGVILFELLTGRTPFEGNAVAVIAKVVADRVPLPSEFRADLPRALVRVIMHTLQRDPRGRFQSMRELAEALAPFGPTQSAAGLVADVQGARGLLGEILVSDGLLTASQLDRALAEQRRSGQLLGRVLLDQGLVARADLLTALAKQQGIGGLASPPIVREADNRVTARAQLRRSAIAARPQWWSSQFVVGLAVGAALGVAGALAAGAATRTLRAPVSGVGLVVSAPGDTAAPSVALAGAPAVTVAATSQPPTPVHPVTAGAHRVAARRAPTFEPDTL